MAKANKHNNQRTPKKENRTAALRGHGPTAFSDRSVEVDEVNGIIKNVALMTVGEALGHPFSIDDTTVDQLIALVNAQPDGTKSRFKHPAIETKRDENGQVVQSVADDTGTLVGRIKSARKTGQQARGDVYLGSYAEVMPGMGNVREYLLRHAKDDPAGIGMSAFFSYDVEPKTDEFGNIIECAARLTEVDAIDFVGTPAANPRGLLSANPNSGWSDDNPADPARAPIPVSTPEFPRDVRGDYLKSIVKDGPLMLGGLAARHSGRLESMRAGADWLVSHGYATKTARGEYAATPKGVTQAALCWK